MSNTVGWKAWGTWSFHSAFAIYTKSARSYVKWVAVCRSIRWNCLKLGHWQQKQGKQPVTCSIQFWIYHHPDYNDEMPFDTEATQYKAAKTTHRCLWSLWSIHPHQIFNGRATRYQRKTSTDIALIGTAWLKPQRGTQTGIEPCMPHVVGRQQHRSNVEAGTPKDYYKRALTISLLDHLISEIDTGILWPQ